MNLSRTQRLIRKNRSTYGGDIFISIKNTVHSSQRDPGLMFIRMYVGKNNDLIVGSFYCPPHSSNTVFKDLQSSIDVIKQKFLILKIILGGDFNCPGK